MNVGDKRNIYRLYTDMTVKIHIENSILEEIAIRDVRQGDQISQKLFTATHQKFLIRSTLSKNG